MRLPITRIERYRPTQQRFCSSVLRIVRQPRLCKQQLRLRILRMTRGPRLKILADLFKVRPRLVQHFSKKDIRLFDPRIDLNHLQKRDGGILEPPLPVTRDAKRQHKLRIVRMCVQTSAQHIRRLREILFLKQPLPEFEVEHPERLLNDWILTAEFIRLLGGRRSLCRFLQPQIRFGQRTPDVRIIRLGARRFFKRSARFGKLPALQRDQTTLQ